MADHDSKQNTEVAFAQMENRLRTAIGDLIQPTIQRVTLAVTDIDILKGLVSQHTRGLQEVQLNHLKSAEQVYTINSFKEEMTRWDQQRRVHEAKVDEQVVTMGQKVDGYSYSLEQKESCLQHLHRSIDRMSMEVNRLIDEQEEQRETFVSRMDAESGKINSLRSELQVQIHGLEMRHNSISDELWGEETGLAKIGGELLKTNSAVSKLEGEVEALHEGKAEAAQLDRLRSDVAKTVHEANSAVASLKHTVGTVVGDVKEHFRTASQTIAAHNMAFVSEVRRDYVEELKAAAVLREEVSGFMGLTAKDMSVLRARVGEADTKASNLASEVREEIEELTRGRKRDKTAADNELKALKRRLGGVFDNSDMVLKGIEHIYGVMEMMLESENVQCSVELQDSVDRQNISLMGRKDDENVLSRTTHSEPQHPRPECRAKTAPGGIKGRPNASARAGNLSARNPQEPVVRVDNRCLGCSNQAPLVMSAFKMACLQYTPSPVEHNGTVRARAELLKQRQSLLQRAHNSLVDGPIKRDLSSALPGSAGNATNPPGSAGAGPGHPPGSAGSNATHLNMSLGASGGDALSAYAMVDGWQQHGSPPSTAGSTTAAGYSGGGGGGGSLRLPNLAESRAGYE